MERALLLSSWRSTTVLGSPAFDHQVLTDHPPPIGVVVTDVTGQDAARIPPVRNVVVLEIQDPEGTYIDVLQADAAYAGRLLTREGVRPLAGNITAGEFTALNTRLLAHGFTQPQITGVIGAGPGGRTRLQIFQLLVAAFRALPHA